MFALLKPASLRQWVLSSFVLALIPLVVLLWQGHRAFNTVSDRALQESQLAVDQARQMENLDNLIVGIERAVRQHMVIDSEPSRNNALEQIRLYREDLNPTCANLLTDLCHEQNVQLDTLTAQMDPSDNLDVELESLRIQHTQITEQAWQHLDERLIRHQDFVAHQQQSLVWQTIGLVLLTLVFVAWASRRISAPIQRLDRMIRAIGQQNTQPLKANIRGPRELNDLGRRLSWLSGRLQQLEALRLALLRHASHELKTPLASIKEGCSLLSDEVAGALTPRQAEVVSLLNASTDRLSQLTEQLLDYNQLLQQSAPMPSDVDPNQLIEHTLKQHQLSLQQRQQTVTVDCECDQLITDATLFQRMLDNLINNAQAYGDTRGQVSIRLYPQHSAMVLEVANTGPAIPETLRTSVFEPFQRGQARRHDALSGSGLGLSVVADCARLLGGTVSIVDTPSFDTCVQVILPPLDTLAPSATPDEHSLLTEGSSA
ncbi:HAMP domain-containing histidine kinase [Natronospirillum operosum]|uniref:histidine kinase n=1 Tax=Natronospirillum operosum TaxID=2759953 RepID=A0A4Z0WAA2_9GAMM|nr:HAMP domain-containing sensor histidine kinase [Natronospirillum operosum]TGG90227.1 HAMP domain-containing histidine kinase [Natronospirillum operosum]